MEKKELQQIFSSAFSEKSWTETLHTVFGASSLFERPKQILLPANEEAETAFELGNFTTTDGRVIGLYKIKVKPKVWLKRNKVGLRALLRNVYKYSVDGAVIVFVQAEKWRLSFVSEIKILSETGEILSQDTEPKRYTYLLGESEKVRTPSERLSRLAGKKLTLQDLLDAFSVEALNEEFYKVIQTFFYKLVGGKIGKAKMQTDYGEGILQLPSQQKENRQIYQEFAVRLIGRTVFCWFLKMKKSGQGKSLLPENLLSSEAVKTNRNYYHTILERLFFQTLNTGMQKRVKNLPAGTEQIPFLNGGLFEPNDHDFYEADSFTGFSKSLNTLKIDDEWFQNFFEELEKYNFTIDENSISDVEVSVDPEILGRIFENLLAEIDPNSGETARKSTGSFYTPREIVDFMATESLVQFLHSKTGLPTEKLTSLFKESETKTQDFSPSEKEAVLDALDKIKILDPACGSGAFPMGILQKIVRTLEKLDPLAVWWKKRQIDRISNPIVRKQLKEKLDSGTSEYARKIGVIQNSLYGVDVQPVAAEISKLRCFLSLVVDENIDETKDNRGIEPLPNLEFKFVTADTLLKLPQKNGQADIFDSFHETTKLENLRNHYLQSYGEDKQKIKQDFFATQQKIFRQQLTGSADKENRAFKLSTWNPFSHEKADWFDPEWMFGVKDFDVVIGNPPYVQLQKNGGLLAKKFEKMNFQTFQRTGDVYSLFYEKGVSLLQNGGILTFITSNKWMRAGYGKSTREFFCTHKPLKLIDLGSGVFQAATVDTNILVIQKSAQKPATQNLLALDVSKEKSFPNFEFLKENWVSLTKLSEESWTIANEIEQKIKEKIEKHGKPLKDWDVKINYGIKTGYNEAFIVDGKKKDELIAKDPKSAEILKPILRGRDIKRYKAEFADLWLIATFPSIKIDIENFPSIKEHLLSFGFQRLEQSGNKGSRKKTSNEWFELQDTIAYHEEFEKEKLVYPNMTKFLPFIFDDKKFYPNPKCFIVTGNNLKFLLGVFNSKVCGFWIRQNCPELQGGTREIQSRVFVNFCVPVLCESNKPNFYSVETLVEKILACKERGEETSVFEREIDELVYGLYGLTEEEIRVVEGR